MFLVAVMNNLPEMILGLCWSIVIFWAGRRFERWRAGHPAEATVLNGRTGRMRKNWLMWGLVILVVLAVVAWAGGAFAGTIRLCTGAANGNYSKVGDMIASFGGQNLEVVVVRDTGGTWGNIDRTVNMDAADPNACDAMIGQPDGPTVLKRDNPAGAGKLIKVGNLHREYLHVICNRAADIGELEDLEGSNEYSVAVGAEGSGGWLIWQNFIAEDADYDAIVPKNLGGIDAIADVAAGNTTCMLQPAGLHNGTVNEANELFAEDVVLVQAQDKDFNDAVDHQGDPLYEFTSIPGGTYPDIQDGMFGSSVDTISWLAAVYMNIDRVSEADRSNFIRAVANARKQAEAEFGD
jgi:TRAP-type uncharacterized transport system substrate-binding protein